MSVTNTKRVFESPGHDAPGARSSGTAEVTVALLEVAGQPFGVLASRVEGVRSAAPVLPLPGSPMLIEGIVNVHGEIVPVLDGRRRLGIAHRPVKATDQFVVLRAFGRRIVLHVDGTAGVVEVPAVELDRAASLRQPTFGCAGIARLKGGLFVLHDTDALLSPLELASLRRAMAVAIAERRSHARG